MVRAPAHGMRPHPLASAATPLHPDIRTCLRDPHWRVREAAIQTLLCLGPEGRHQLYEHFLISPDRTLRGQILEVIERRGLLPALVEEYCAGITGMGALIVEQLASDAAPPGISCGLRTLNPEILQKFQYRFLPDGQSKAPLPESVKQEVAGAKSLQRVHELPPFRAA